MKIKFENIPAALKSLPQWVLWKEGKVPYSVNGTPAKANDSSTWSSYEDVVRVYERGGYEGIGFEFSADDGLVGIDLDGCCDLAEGAIEPWAREILDTLDTYAEVSPSGNGIKLFVKAKLVSSWRKVHVDGANKVCDKEPGIELYDSVRYFTVTGNVCKGRDCEPRERQAELDALVAKYQPKQTVHIDFASNTAVVERARKYLATMPVAIDGQRGHDVTYRTACVLVQGFALDRGDALGLLAEWNQGCQPPWNERELAHKIDDAAKASGPRGYLRDVPQQRWASVQIPKYVSPPPVVTPAFTTLVGAAQKHLAALKAGTGHLIETGLPDLDYALGGGVEAGELVILASRPSHGKSATALQCIHHWTSLGMPVLLISEEMSDISLGKRTLQYASALPVEHWETSMQGVERDLNSYSVGHADCFVAQGCRTAEAAAATIEKAVRDHGVQCVVVDYAGLLQGKGGTRYEQQTNTSVIMRHAASGNNVVLLMQCQLNREIESREKFIPRTSDLRDSGQWEQDADVIIFCCWPHKIDSTRDPHDYQFYVTKNRNRAINQHFVECYFNPSRQMITGTPHRSWTPPPKSTRKESMRNSLDAIEGDDFEIREY